MKVLITGGAGFIGSHLAEKLLEREEEVYVVDDCSTGSLENIENIKFHPKFHYVIGSINDKNLLPKLVNESDVIYHLAAVVGVKLVIENPAHTAFVNLHGTEYVLELASKRNKPVLIASTSEVYGKGIRFPLSETDDVILGPTINNIWSYAYSKAMNEVLAFNYYREKKVPVVIVRIFNTVGPRQTGRYGMVVPTFVSQALNNKPITVFGTGEQTRCFNHVLDTVSGLMSLMSLDEAVGQVFNLGNDCEISIMDLAKKVKSKTGCSSEIKPIPYKEGYREECDEIQRRIPNLTKIRNLVGYSPKYSLDDILEDVVSFEKKKVFVIK